MGCDGERRERCNRRPMILGFRSTVKLGLKIELLSRKRKKEKKFVNVIARRFGNELLMLVVFLKEEAFSRKEILEKISLTLVFFFVSFLLHSVTGMSFFIIFLF
ncbi:hypothetical protein M8C21_028860 [Ambrosia artemisiifolia]|uniref:Uncharacterized protein n=1 Tax=Ambrosia artemisiifolia TaxID=4212 RepID=A0AAD5CGZ7_AMBAR|nr:hypothetical protein M8C21_028860 [Ambrosia artemisiifolia]